MCYMLFIHHTAVQWTKHSNCPKQSWQINLNYDRHHVIPYFMNLPWLSTAQLSPSLPELFLGCLHFWKLVDFLTLPL